MKRVEAVIIDSPMRKEAAERAVNIEGTVYLIPDDIEPQCWTGQRVTVEYEPQDQYAYIVRDRNAGYHVLRMKDKLAELEGPMWEDCANILRVQRRPEETDAHFKWRCQHALAALNANWPPEESREQEPIGLLIMAELRQQHGISASYEYPGFLQIAADPEGKTYWALGDINETWGANLAAKDGEPLDDYIELNIPSESRDAKRIAEAFAKALESKSQFNRRYMVFWGTGYHQDPDNRAKMREYKLERADDLWRLVPVTKGDTFAIDYDVLPKNVPELELAEAVHLDQPETVTIVRIK